MKYANETWTKDILKHGQSSSIKHEEYFLFT